MDSILRVQFSIGIRVFDSW